MKRLWVALLLVSSAAFAVDTTVLPDPELQQRYEALTHELRCMQCMNNSIADSPVGLASDLRRDVKELLETGKTDDEIRAYMVARYGDFVLYRPPLKATTVLLWLGPFLLLAIGALVLVRRVRRQKAGPELSEAERARAAQLLEPK